MPPGYHVVARLCEEEEIWMHALTRRVGREYGVNPDDLRQDLLEQLLHRDDLDLDRPGWRAWVARRARWRAGDMSRRDRRVAVEPELSDHRLAEAPVSPPLDVDADVRRMRAMNLNPDEARILLYLRWGFGDTAVELAEIAGATAAKVRQDKRRGIGKILGFAALTPAEQEAVSAGMHAPSHSAAAARLGVTEKVLTALLREAAQKIGRAYDDAGRDVPNV